MVLICLLRGVNVGGHHKGPMAGLRTVCASLKLGDAQTCLQSGNVVFRAAERNPDKLARGIEDALERKFGFRPDVMLRTTAEMKDAIARNPFAHREPGKVAVVFLKGDPGEQARQAFLGLDTAPEQVHVEAREVYIYFPNGMGRPRFTTAMMEKTIKTPGTARNWNTVRKLLEIAEKMAAS